MKRNLKRRIYALRHLCWIVLIISLFYLGKSINRSSINDDDEKSEIIFKIEEEKKRSVCESIPEWVIDLNMIYLFNWTWFSNGECYRYVHLLNNQNFLQVNDKTSSVINDVKDYLKFHPNEGFIVDDYEQLPNVVPHPLPRSLNLTDTCYKLNLMGIDGWESCLYNGTILSKRIPNTTHTITVGILNGFIDNGSCDEAVPGTIYTQSKTFRFQQWCTKQCCYEHIHTNHTNKQIEHHSQLLNSIGVYPMLTGHFGPEQLPRIIRLLAVAPSTAKLLVATGGIADQLIDILIENHLITRDRIVPYREDRIYSANIVYRTESWPHLNSEKDGTFAFDRTDMETVHKAFIHQELPDQQRNLILIVKRIDNSPRSLSNHHLIVQLIEQILPNYQLNLEINIFTGNGHVRDHINQWQRAKIVIASHGAGLYNVIWCKPGTFIFEIGFDDEGPLPEMYFQMSSHSNHPYWLIKGQGKRSQPILADLNHFKWALKDAFHLLQTSN